MTEFKWGVAIPWFSPKCGHRCARIWNEPSPEEVASWVAYMKRQPGVEVGEPYHLIGPAPTIEEALQRALERSEPILPPDLQGMQGDFTVA